MNDVPEKPPIANGRDTFREVLPWVAIPALSFAWFWFWRAGVMAGGDSEQWERAIHGGTWLNKRQMLSFATIQFVYQVSHAALGWTARMAFYFVSCAAGALSMLIAWRMVAGTKAVWLKFAVVATAGFTFIFYGHIETYACPAAALLLHLLAVERNVQGRWSLWTVPATFSLMLGFHLVAMFMLPAVFVVTAVEAKRRDVSVTQVFLAALGFAPAILLWCAIRYWGLGEGPMEARDFSSPIMELRSDPIGVLLHPWRIIGTIDFPLRLRFAFWNGGLAALLAPVLLIQRFRDRSYLYLGIYFACFVAFTLGWKAYMDGKDADLHSFPWIVAVVIVARGVTELRFRIPLLAALFVGNAYLWVTRPLAFADLPRPGHGTIVFVREEEASSMHALLDERLSMEAINRFIPSGPHSVRILRRGMETENLEIEVEDGMRYEIQIGSGGRMQLKAIDSEQKPH